MSAELAALKAPFPWFGGKTRVAVEVWKQLGGEGQDACRHYIEPFLGSAAVLLARPGGAGHLETVNDADGFLVNLWRALRSAPQKLTEAVVGPVSEVDTHARHLVLLERKNYLVQHLLSDPYAFDIELAAWWLIGQCATIGGKWCLSKGPWGRLEDGTFGRVPPGHTGPRLGRQLPSIAGHGNGYNAQGANAPAWFADLSVRLQRVRIAQGDWKRVLGPSVIGKSCGHPVAIFFDPPYDGYDNLYAERTASSISDDVREWALAHGDDPSFRIALCGYEGEHKMPDSWSVLEWKAIGGYGNQGNKQGRENSHRERIWFSPHCLGKRNQLELF